MKILALIEKLADVADSKEQLQKELNIFEGGHLWNLLVSRYDVVERTQTLENFAQDPDLKLVIKSGLKILKKQIANLENIIKQYGIPLPKRPPVASESVINVEVITDEFIFRSIFSGIQSFIPIHASALIHTTSPKFRETFLTMLINEVGIYDKLFIYGQLKGWILDPPAYRV